MNFIKYVEKWGGVTHLYKNNNTYIHSNTFIEADLLNMYYIINEGFYCFSLETVWGGAVKWPEQEEEEAEPAHRVD